MNAEVVSITTMPPELRVDTKDMLNTGAERLAITEPQDKGRTGPIVMQSGKECYRSLMTSLECTLDEALSPGSPATS